MEDLKMKIIQLLMKKSWRLTAQSRDLFSILMEIYGLEKISSRMTPTPKIETESYLRNF